MFKKYRRGEPPHSCPEIDESIRRIESARMIHDELREWAYEHYDRAEQLDEELEDVKRELELARSSISELEKLLEEKENQ